MNYPTMQEVHEARVLQVFIWQTELPAPGTNLDRGMDRDEIMIKYARDKAVKDEIDRILEEYTYLFDGRLCQLYEQYTRWRDNSSKPKICKFSKKKT